MPTTSGRVRFPEGWELLTYEPTTDHRAPFVAYKFLTQADLSTTFVADSILTPVRTMCSHGYVLRNVHRNRPFGTPVAEGYCGRGRSKAIAGTPLLYDDQHVLQIVSFRGGSSQAATPLPWADQVGPTSFDASIAAYIFDSGSDVGSQFVNSYLWLANVKQGENWFGYETKYNCIEPTEWTFSSCTRTQTPLTRSVNLAVPAVNVRHHAERQVLLEAGQKYCFYVQAHSNGSSGGYGVALTYVDPSGNERAARYRSNSGSTGSTGSAVINDPLSDHGTVWIHDHWSSDNDGVPSSGGGWQGLWFTALTSGTYTLRICNITTSTESLAGLTFSAGQALWMTNAVFRRGWHAPAKVYSPFGPVYEGDFAADFNTGASTVGFLTTVGFNNNPAGANEIQIWAFPVNPAWEAFPPARCSTNYIGPPGVSIDNGNDDGRSFATGEYLGDDMTYAVKSDTMVWPKIDGVYKSYYCEVKVDAIAAGSMRVLLCAPENMTGAEFSNSIYSYTFDPTATTDIVGILIDYVAGEAKFYFNNVLAQTNTFPAQTYPATGIAVRDRPFALLVDCAVNAGYHWFTVNLHGDFAYPPAAGVLPFDALGDPNLEAGNGLVQNTGGGTELGINGPNGEIIFKTLYDGAGISFVETPTDVTIQIDKADVPNVVPTIRVRGAAWSNPAGIDSLEASVVSVLCPHAGVITSWTVLGNAAGSAEIDVHKMTYASFPTATLISGTNPPKLVSQQKNRDLGLSGWTTAVAAGDIITFTLQGCTGLELVSVQITIQEVIP
jgi:hypothetical protein